MQFGAKRHAAYEESGVIQGEYGGDVKEERGEQTREVASSLLTFFLVSGGSKKIVSLKSEGLWVIPPERTILFANIKNTNFLIFWNTMNDWCCAHNLYMST